MWANDFLHLTRGRLRSSVRSLRATWHNFVQIMRKIMSWKCVGGLLFGGMVALTIYAAHLSDIVKEKFEGPRFQLPTNIYARPLELFPGKKWPKRHIVSELTRLGYASVQEISGPGEFADTPDYLEIYSRQFSYLKDKVPAYHIRLTFSNDHVSTLQNAVSGQDLIQFKLEPLRYSSAASGEHEDRKLIRFEELPQHLIDALVSIEDERFYQHIGIDPRSIVRAIYSTASGNGVQGGSTLTQQLVKNFYLTPEQTIKRKLNEMLMAVILDWHYEKNEILQVYFNEVYFGQDGVRAIHGIELASQYFFAKSASKLQVHEAATLVGMLKGPSYYNPRRHNERAKTRRNIVLKKMFELGHLTEEQFGEATDAPLLTVASGGQFGSQNPGYIDRAFRELKDNFVDVDLDVNGLQIYTTLDPIIQDIAEKQIPKTLTDLEQKFALPAEHLQAAVVIIEPLSGKIIAMVGDRNIGFDGFNRAIDAKRQVGSLMKPFVYLNALDHPDRYSLMSMLDDSELTVEQRGQAPWTPQNYDRQYHGVVPLWQALAQSYNVASVRLGLDVGLESVVGLAHSMGASTQIEPYASAVLGAQEMNLVEIAQMYSTLAAKGYRVPLHSVSAVISQDDELRLPTGHIAKPVVAEQANYLTVSALQKVIEEGTAKSLSRWVPKKLGVAGKTGTSDALRDSWFVGFSDQYVGVVWIGNDKNKATKLTGASGAMVLWGKIFKDLDIQAHNLLMPKGVREHYVHRLSGRRVSSRCQEAIKLPFIVGSEPKKQFGCSGRKPTLKDEKSNWLLRLFGGDS